MPGFLIRALVCAAGLWLAAQLVGGIHLEPGSTLVWAALLLGVVNAFVRPLVVLLTLPVTVLTLGLFLWVINAGMLLLVARLIGGLQVDGFGSALLGALVVGATSWLASWYVGPRGQVDVVVVRR